MTTAQCTQLFVGGLLSLALAIFALIAERRRLRRRNLDAVGIMPWESIFVLALLGTVVMLSFALKGWLST